MDFTKNLSKKNYQEFSDFVMQIYQETGDAWSSRGWCYILEGKGIITKDQFSKVNTWLNNCIKLGLIPVDIVEGDSARMFHGVYDPDTEDLKEYIAQWLRYSFNCPHYYRPDYYKLGDEKFYIQVVVEKVDLVKIFSPVCEKYLIPIANARGWPSVLQRATYTDRYKEAERLGLKPILLYVGDYDPDGLRIADTIRNNIEDVKDIVWLNGKIGYDPKNLQIKRIGINLDFIKKNKLPWIDNLITGSGLNLASPKHRNYNLRYVQNYLKKIGEKKCEANAIVLCQEEARQEFENNIISIIGNDRLEKREKLKRKFQNKIQQIMDKGKIQEKITDIIRSL